MKYRIDLPRPVCSTLPSPSSFFKCASTDRDARGRTSEG